MFIKRGVFIVFLIIFAYSVSAQSVARSLSTTTVVVGETVTVTLSVTVGGADAYAIDELIPTGWTVSDAGSASTDHSGHLKWVVVGESTNSGYNCGGLNSCINSISDTTYVYTLTAPASAGTATLTGEYMFDTDSASRQIGSTTLTVVTDVCSPNNNDQQSCNAETECEYCPLNNQCMAAGQIACSTAGCIDDMHWCNSQCAQETCGTGQKCKTNQCETCVPSWTCTDWAPAVCPSNRLKTRTCTDSNGCDADKTEQTRCSPGSTTTNTSNNTTTTRPPRGTTTTTTNTTTTTRTRSTTTTPPGTTTTTRRTTTTEPTQQTPSSTGRQRTTTPIQTEEPTPQQVIEDEEKKVDYLFYVLAGILVAMVAGGLYYYKKGHIAVHTGNVNMPPQQPPQNKYRPF